MKSAIATVIAALLLASCATGQQTPSSAQGPGWYTVKRSDTLYSIAWRYGLDYHQLAQWNQIDAKGPIYPGQRLRLLKPHGQATPGISAGASTGASSKAGTVSSSSSASSSKSTSKSKVASASSGGSAAMRNPGKWIWPTKGKPLNTFLASQLDRRGIDIAGKQGQPIVAVADGKVVYSGNGLAGYGNLIIIKHSETYLSAYAYCQERLVEEGMAVKAGKLVARMGQNDNIAMLHFEIRRNGKPVDPIKYLPNQ